MTRLHKANLCFLAVCIILLAGECTALRINGLRTPEDDRKHIEESTFLLSLLSRMQQESAFETLLVYSYQPHRSPHNPPEVGNLLRTTNLSIILINEKSHFNYKNKFSSSAAVLIYARSLRILHNNFQVLRGVRGARHLVFVYGDRESTQNVLIEASKFCSEFFFKEIYNVLLTFRNIYEKLFVCRKYPLKSSNYIIKYANSSDVLFTNQFLDMHGDDIITHPDQLPPGTMLFYDNRKQLQIDGYVGNLLSTYAEQRNATLKFKYPIELGKIMFYMALLDAARNGSLDIAASLTPTMKVDSFDEVTMPYEISSYCLMVPLTSYLPIHKIFTGIVDQDIMLAIFAVMVVFAVLLTYSTKGGFHQFNFVNIFSLLNDNILRGFLGQSFILHARPTFNTRFLLFLLCYTSLLTNTMYQAYLGSFLTEPPRFPPIRNYLDMKARGIKLLLPAGEIALLSNTSSYTRQLYKNGFEFVGDYNTFAKKRDSMDTRYVYPVSETRWNVFNEQQKFFRRPIFSYVRGKCIVRSLVLCLPIRDDLPYRDLFEDHILRVHAFGLMDRWLSLNYYTMIRLKLIFFNDPSKKRREGPLKMLDFLWIWKIYLLCLIISLLAFVLELLFSRRRSIVRLIYKRLRSMRKNINATKQVKDITN